jgi:hypothetical protein
VSGDEVEDYSRVCWRFQLLLVYSNEDGLMDGAHHWLQNLYFHRHYLNERPLFEMFSMVALYWSRRIQFASDMCLPSSTLVLFL